MKPKMISHEEMQKRVNEQKAERLLGIRNVSVMCGYALLVSGFTAGAVVAALGDVAAAPAIMLVGMVLVAFGEMIEARIKKIVGG